MNQQITITQKHLGNIGGVEVTTLHVNGVDLGLMGVEDGKVTIAMSAIFGSHKVTHDCVEQAIDMALELAGIQGRRTLELSAGSFDQKHSFTLEIPSRKGTRLIRCKLYQGYEAENDGVYWAMQCNGAVKAQYTSADQQERVRLAVQQVIRDGDIVRIADTQYRVTVIGDYSNAATFEKV